MKKAITVLSGLPLIFLLSSLTLFGQASSGEYPEYKFIKTQGEYSIGAQLGTIRFQGRGTARSFVDGAQIKARISGAPADGIIPSSLYFLTGEDQLFSRLVINEKGYLGVNDDNPMSRMSIRHFYSATDAPDFSIFSVEGGVTGAPKQFSLVNSDNGGVLKAKLQGDFDIIDNGRLQFFLPSSSNPEILISPIGNSYFNNGNVGFGTSSPEYKVDIAGNTRVQGSTFILGTNDGEDTGQLDGQRALVHTSNDRLVINYGGDFEGGTFVEGNRLTCKVLEITGGNDVAEPGEITGGLELEAGSVVVIDSENPGKFKESTISYDKRVAGVISGAGGVQPGMILKQKGKLDKGQPMAISGKVFVRTTASNGAIKPGDLLTTSHLSGRAMKATNRRKSRGAVIGKAMTELKAGEGLVLVLIQPQ
ncbi:MAG: hypothetical protein J5I98_14575 [Phaeodactylibacter sp.]|nr:hypothetical protein [Phaeodactylibacter sp.]